MFRKFISPWAYPLEVNLAEQFNFGHREVLFAANGMSFDSILGAKLQHGWYATPTKVNIERTRWMKKRTSLVWSRRIASTLSNLGVNNSIVIGAPWVHLLRALNFDPLNSDLNSISADNLLYFPNHSGVGYHTFPTQDISVLAHISGVSKVSVSLFWKDFINPQVRQFYSREFSTLLCHGFRGSSGFEIPWSDEGGRTMFLPNLLVALKTHDIIVASPWSTAFWYALSLGKKIMIPNESELGHDYDFKQISKVKIGLEETLEQIHLNLPIGQVFHPNSEQIAYALDELGWDESLNIMSSRRILKLLKKTKISPEIGVEVCSFIKKNSGRFDSLEV